MKILNPKNLILKHNKTGRIFKTNENTDYLEYDENAFKDISIKKQDKLF